MLISGSLFLPACLPVSLFCSNCQSLSILNSPWCSGKLELFTTYFPSHHFCWLWCYCRHRVNCWDWAKQQHCKKPPTDCEISAIFISHAVRHGSNKHGYEIKFDVCRLYHDHTYWILGYNTSQNTGKCHQHASSLCTSMVVNNDGKQDSSPRNAGFYVYRKNSKVEEEEENVDPCSKGKDANLGRWILHTELEVPLSICSMLKYANTHKHTFVHSYRLVSRHRSWPQSHCE